MEGSAYPECPLKAATIMRPNFAHPKDLSGADRNARPPLLAPIPVLPARTLVDNVQRVLNGRNSPNFVCDHAIVLTGYGGTLLGRGLINP